jgi:aldehyde:ferredoxin oxidoreductase
MKKCGYDAYIIRGRAPGPTFLEISDIDVRFHDAADLWGKDIYETEDLVQKKVNVTGAQALSIGPAGENLVRFANIGNNKWRQAGRTGMGAVMGSKNLKSIVFHGDKEPQLADKAMLDGLAGELLEKSKNNPGVERYRSLGTPMIVAIANAANAFPTEYWSKGRLEGWENISSDALLRDFDVKPKACPRCFFACGKLSAARNGRHKGLTIEGPEYETIYSFGGLCKITDLREIAYLNDICDRLGMDTITGGNLVAFCMELARRGRLSEKFDYGNPDHAAELLQKISRREGLGAVLAEGIKPASRELMAEDLAVHVKGLEPAGYDPRVLKGMSLGYATSPRGACHLPATFYIFEMRGIYNPAEVKGKAEAYIGWEDRLTIMDTLIMCRFFRDLVGWQEYISILKAAAGVELDEKRLREIANNISTLRRLLNIREGWTKADDMLPARFHDEPVAGQKVDRAEFNSMLEEYYRLRGWDKNGIPHSLVIPA